MLRFSLRQNNKDSNLSRLFPALIFFLAFFCGFRPGFSADTKYGGELILAATSDPRSFNPILAKETSTTSITQIIFEGLTRTNGLTLAVEPALALSWSVDKSGLVWDFKLRRDVVWFDGERFSADDVIFTFNKLIYNDDIPNSARDIFSIEGQPVKVQKIDEFHVRFILPKKFAPFLRAMSTEILPKHILESSVENGKFNFTWGADSKPSEIIGTGPFMLSQYIPGERIVLRRNPDYYRRDKNGNNLPYMEKIIFIILGNQDTALLKFLDGEIDYYSLRGTDYPLLKPKEKERDFTIYNTGPAFGSNFIVFNQNSGLNPRSNKPYINANKLGWFKDVNFRKAIAHSIDKEMIIQILMNGFGIAQDSAMSPSAGFFYNPDVEAYDYDLDKARDILDESGYKDIDGDGLLEDENGKDIEFSLYTSAQDNQRIQMAAIISNDLSRIGIKVNFLPLEFNNLVQRLTSTFDWDAMIIGLTGGIEPHFGRNVWASSGRLHMWNPEQLSPQTSWERRIDEIFDLAVQELDEKNRKSLYDEWQVIVSKELPLIYTVLSDSMFAVRNKFGNLKLSSFGGAFHNLEEIYIKN
ncbi:MAG: ABC transporter substrate-binding protein [Candidatus Omnitrophica bacterium CG11_big_fil_rev_8_21_14_0_20_42_13]|uniref:ABC transporter substrate-binding protein n=1 Tax=Candidatus Ghiorseimicrobium undicola TaxID=1974746 RepID=A0A2H0LVN9_9BACT|nr:MAG: ABC transporter substrate-binding protein [Candidatus Omnitrophica bacterium CG11_big_fil_rev_8_21_14_0_20_42_13]